MKKKIVSIKGVSGTGKSTTIKLAYQMFLERLGCVPISYDAKYEAYQYSRGWDKDFMDFTAVVTVCDYQVVFHSPGDHGYFVNLVDKFRSDSCLIIICATRTKGSSIDELNNIAKDGYTPEYITKTSANDIENENIAKQLLKKISDTFRDNEIDGLFNRRAELVNKMLNDL